MGIAHPFPQASHTEQMPGAPRGEGRNHHRDTGQVTTGVAGGLPWSEANTGGAGGATPGALVYVGSQMRGLKIDH